MENEHKCKLCGKTFTPTCHTTKQVFCSKECRFKHNNAKRYEPPNNECVHCGDPLDISVSKGRNRKFCDDDCRKRHFLQAVAEKKRKLRKIPRVCKNCGREFLPTWETGAPKFCSDECRLEYWSEYNKYHEKNVQEKLICEYCGKPIKTGRYCDRVCYRLGSARIRGEKRCGWCGKILAVKAKKHKEYCSDDCAMQAWKSKEGKSGVGKTIKSKNIDAWRFALAEQTRNSHVYSQPQCKILLVCRKTNLCSTDALINTVRFELGLEPFDGNTYVFCNVYRNKMKWIRWDGSEFEVSERRCERGTYSWPICEEQTVLEVTGAELDYLLGRRISAKETL